jgi:hypothetical protein
MSKKSHITRREFIEASALAGMSLAMKAGGPSERMAAGADAVYILNDGNVTPKVAHGINHLSRALKEAGVPHQVQSAASEPAGSRVIRVQVNPAHLPADARLGEAFSIKSRGDETHVSGFDEAGTLYACAELAARIRKSNGLPENMDINDSPKMSMRGIPLFLMTAGTYMYPIVESQFPWFYDKDLWIKTLDFLAEHRLNFISFWNAHPFPFFVTMEKYPEAKMVSDEELARNEKLLGWLSSEADKRNIWLMFQFYNIYVPEGFAKARGADEKDEHIEFSNGYAVLREPTSWAAEYTRYAVKEFVQKYPSLGLYVCLGEALQKDQSSWMDDVILAGVKDSGKRPPVILRNWFLHDDLQILKNAVASYDNLRTEMKQNEEMYAVPEPDPANVKWIQHSPGHIINVHLMGNLKPFRWAPPSFIQETAKDQQEMGAKGVQVYPLWVWYWPYSADRQRLLQIDRDWLWYAAWGRYAWNSDRPRDQERQYWAGKIAERYGEGAALDILGAYEATGRVMPIVPRMFWFKGWNHWFASNALTLEQTLEGTPIPYTNIQRTVSVERFAKDLAVGKPVGNDVLTPVGLTGRMVSNGARGVELIQKAAPLVEKNKEEFDRLQVDFEATSLIAQIYRARVDAAVRFVAYQLHPTPEKGAQVLSSLEKSVDCYRQLVAKTNSAYPVANDISNDIPFPFRPPSVSPHANSIPHLPHWRNFLPVFEAELEVYRRLLGKHSGPGI